MNTEYDDAKAFLGGKINAEGLDRLKRGADVNKRMIYDHAFRVVIATAEERGETIRQLLGLPPIGDRTLGNAIGHAIVQAAYNSVKDYIEELKASEVIRRANESTSKEETETSNI